MQLICALMGIWNVLMGESAAGSQTQSYWFRARTQDYRTREFLPATWRWTDSTGRILNEQRTAAAGFAGYVARSVRYLTVESPGYRSIRLPVRVSGPATDSASFRVVIPLVPIDKPGANRPYFQSEQQPVKVPMATRNSARVLVQVSVGDALTDRPVVAEVCLISTKNHRRTCYRGSALSTEFVQPDIVALEVRAPNYQTYWGNLVVGDTADVAPLRFTIRLNPTPTLFTATLTASTDAMGLRLKRLPAGPDYTLTPADSIHFFGAAPPGTYQLIRVGRGRVAVFDTVLLTEGLNVGPRVDLPTHNPIGGIADGTIYFAQSSYEISDSSRRQLDRISVLMRQQPGQKLLIVGHSDNIGEPRLNVALSEFRAKTIRTYLRKRGINEARLRIEFVGGSRPAASNETEEQRRLNRRVSLYFR